MKSPESLPIVYEPATGSFSCQLPDSICNDLLLSYETGRGISVCHQQMEKLENLIIKIATLRTEAKILRGKSERTQRRKRLTAAFILTLLVVAVFFSEPFFQDNPSFRLPFSIVGAITAMYCFYILVTNYLFGGLYGKGADTLRHELAFADLQKQIKQEFNCQTIEH